jgi:hypothetical protein
MLAPSEELSVLLSGHNDCALKSGPATYSYRHTSCVHSMFTEIHRVSFIPSDKYISSLALHTDVSFQQTADVIMACYARDPSAYGEIVVIAFAHLVIISALIICAMLYSRLKGRGGIVKRGSKPTPPSSGVKAKNPKDDTEDDDVDNNVSRRGSIESTTDIPRDSLLLEEEPPLFFSGSGDSGDYSEEMSRSVEQSVEVYSLDASSTAEPYSLDALTLFRDEFSGTASHKEDGTTIGSFISTSTLQRDISILDDDKTPLALTLHSKEMSVQIPDDTFASVEEYYADGNDPSVVRNDFSIFSHPSPFQQHSISHYPMQNSSHELTITSDEDSSFSIINDLSWTVRPRPVGIPPPGFWPPTDRNNGSLFSDSSFFSGPIGSLHQSQQNYNYSLGGSTSGVDVNRWIPGASSWNPLEATTDPLGGVFTNTFTATDPLPDQLSMGLNGNTLRANASSDSLHPSYFSSLGPSESMFFGIGGLPSRAALSEEERQRLPR